MVVIVRGLRQDFEGKSVLINCGNLRPERREALLKSTVNRGSGMALTVVLRVLHLLGRIVGYGLYVSRSSRYRHSCTNIKLCFPDLSDQEVDRLAHSSLAELGKLLFETLLFWVFPRVFCCHAVREVVGEEHLRRALEEGKGVILVCPHLGNWEVFNAYAGRFNATVTYKPLKLRWLDGWIRRCRERNGSVLVPINSPGIKALCGGLARGGVVTLFPDQVPDGAAGRALVPFFNTPAWTGTLVSRLAQRPNVNIICGYARRLPAGRGFEIHLMPAPEEIYTSDIERSARALNQGIEACIRQASHQYLWQYKRFKGAGCPRLYQKARSSPA